MATSKIKAKRIVRPQKDVTKAVEMKGEKQNADPKSVETIGTAKRTSVNKRRAKKNNALASPEWNLPTHVLVRVKSDDGRTIGAHQKVILDNGSAILGKIGQALSAAFIKTLNDQIDQQKKTYLFLTTREGWNGPYVTYQCMLKRVEDKLEESKRELVPKYYSAEHNKIHTWFEISSIDKMSKLDMNRIFVLSSGREIMSVINSSATVFRVGMKER